MSENMRDILGVIGCIILIVYNTALWYRIGYKRGYEREANKRFKK